MCAECDGATPEEVLQHLSDSIDWYDWAIQGVEASRQNWGWVYTVGLMERFNHPELVIASMHEFNAVGGILNTLGERIQLGGRFEAGAQTVVSGLDVEFVKVHPRQFERDVFNMWFAHYRSPGPALAGLQVLLPSHLFYPDTGPQPRLDQPGDVLTRSPHPQRGRR
jgi:hypothetical protein